MKKSGPDDPSSTVVLELRRAALVQTCNAALEMKIQVFGLIVLVALLLVIAAIGFLATSSGSRPGRGAIIAGAVLQMLVAVDSLVRFAAQQLPIDVHHKVLDVWVVVRMLAQAASLALIASGIATLTRSMTRSETTT